MPVKMTRSEYEAKYGSAPQPATDAAPVKMTAAQYEAKYGAAPKPVEPEKTLGSQLGERYQQGVKGVLDAAKKPMSPINPIPGGRLFLRGAGAAGGAVGDIAGAAIDKVLPDGVQKKIGETIAPVVKPVVETGRKIMGGIEKVSPETAQDIRDAANSTNLFIGGAVTKVPAKAALKAAESAIPKASEAAIAAKVASDFNKGIKPAATAITKGQAEKKTAQIVDAVKLIQENKPNLKFIDDAGEEVVGRTPESIFELSDALDQTKKGIFNKYSAMPKAAGEKGLVINPAKIGDELEAVVSNKALQLTNPEAIQYAKTVQDRFRKIGDLDPDVVQDVIKNYNESLKAFYRNPTYTDATRAAIDAMTVNNLRKMLDEGIEGLEGAGYQALKNQYQSLKAVERDIVRAATREAKKGATGLIDYTDIFTGADLLAGILTLSPSAVARGAFGRGVKELYKYMGDPNRAVGRMFKNAEKLPSNSIFRTTKKPAK